MAQSQAIKAQLLVKEKEKKEVKVASLSQKEKKELGDISQEQQNQLMTFAKQEADLIHKKRKLPKKRLQQLRLPRRRLPVQRQPKAQRLQAQGLAHHLAALPRRLTMEARSLSLCRGIIL